MKVNIDLGALIKGLGKVLPQVPTMAAEAGFSLPIGIQRYLPMVIMGSGMLDKVGVSMSGADITVPGMPDTGKPGRGRSQYLMSGQQFSDEQVCKALDLILNNATGSGVAECHAAIKFARICIYGDVSTDPAAEARAALDKVLKADGMGEGLCDKLGDMVYFALSQGYVK